MAAICELLLRLYPLRQALLARQATETLHALCMAPSARLPPAVLDRLLGSLLAQEGLVLQPRGGGPGGGDAAAGVVAAVALLDAALVRLAKGEPGTAAARLPRAFHALMPLLGADTDGVRLAACAALQHLVAECVDATAVAAALASAGARAPLVGVLAAVESSLGARYQEAWGGSVQGAPRGCGRALWLVGGAASRSCKPRCDTVPSRMPRALPPTPCVCSVAAELIKRLGRAGAPLAAGLLQRLGELCAGADEAAAQGAAVDEATIAAAQSALGAALCSLGPEAVLAALPLNLLVGLDAAAQRGPLVEARTWLLALLCRHVRGARLSFWGAALLPLARQLATRAAAAAQSPARQREAQICGALEAQVWLTLPAFCSWAEDGGEALRCAVAVLQRR